MDVEYKNLIFEGGGVKGIAYGGALAVLDRKGFLNGIVRVAGTSAGAINATLLALGYTHQEVSDIIIKTDFSSFADNSWFGANIWRLINKYGWNRGVMFQEFIGTLIKRKTGKPDFTFNELADKVETGTKGFRHLYMVATNLSKQRAQLFSHETDHHPDTPIRDAVRMSMGIPLYFQSFRFGADIMVDGGVSLNYPVHLFDNKRYLVNPENGEEFDYNDEKGFIFNHETLGFRLDSKQVIDYARRNWATPPEQIKNIKEYSGALINFMMEMANKKHLHKNDWGRTIFIDTLDVQTTDFNLPEVKIDALIDSGKNAVKAYFEWKDPALPGESDLNLDQGI